MIVNNNVVPYPRIRVADEEEESLEIIAAGLVICHENDFVSAFAMLMAVYYIYFNIAYPSNISSSLLFYQKLFVGLSDNIRDGKVSSSVCKLAN